MREPTHRAHHVDDQHHPAALGEAGATVICTGRTTKTSRSEYDRPETIEETAELVTRLGGKGVPIAVDHLDRGGRAEPAVEVGQARVEIAGQHTGRPDLTRQGPQHPGRGHRVDLAQAGDEPGGVGGHADLVADGGDDAGASWARRLHVLDPENGVLARSEDS